MTALLRGDVEMVCLPAIRGDVRSFRSGAVKILAVSDRARSVLLPGIPTLRESRHRRRGRRLERPHIAPAATPDAIVARIAREVAEVITARTPRQARPRN